MFGRHKAIERFSVIFLTLFLAMSILMVTIVVRKNAADKTLLSNQAIYTTNVAMSRSHVSGEVVDVMTSQDKTKAFLLLRMNSMENLSANASDYRAFLTGATESQGYADLKSQPSGGIYVFGTSGYIGVYLVNHEPYPSQILNLVIRGIKDYSSSSGEDSYAEVPSGGDSSFVNFDQMQIYFNPGANEARHVEFLDAGKIDIEEMYKEAIIESQELALHDVLSQDLQSMFESKRLAEQYLSRLTDGTHGSVITAPDLPDSMATDEIVAYTYDGNVELSWSDTKNGWVDSKDTKYEPDAYYLDLKSDYHFTGGYDIDWQTTSCKEGWLDELRGTASEDAFLNEQDALLAQAAKDGEMSFSQDAIEFYYGSGEVFEVDVNSSDSKIKNISSDINKLLSAWQTYFELKVKYETEDLRELLYLERDARIASTTYTENFSDDVLVNY